MELLDQLARHRWNLADVWPSYSLGFAVTVRVGTSITWRPARR